MDGNARAMLVPIFTSTIIILLLYYMSATLKVMNPDNDWTEDYDFSVQLCWENFPYTYSKCLNLCDANKDPTCLDDQLCLCDSTITFNQSTYQSYKSHPKMQASTPPTAINENFGASRDASCRFSDFCEQLCQDDEKLQALFENDNRAKVGIKGALCKTNGPGSSSDQEIESCVCRILKKYLIA